MHCLLCIILLSWKVYSWVSEIDVTTWLLSLLDYCHDLMDKQLSPSSAKRSISPTAFNQILCLSTCSLFLPTPIANRHNSSVLHDINNQGQLENDPQCNLALPSAWEASHFSFLPPSCPTPLCPHPLSLQTSELYTILTYVYTFPASECWHMTN